MKITLLGLSLTSSWGNGHATTYRSLVKALEKRGHHVIFLERDTPWYAENRDLPEPPHGELHLYRDLAELRDRYAGHVTDADVVVVGSYVPDGVEVARWVHLLDPDVSLFYDIDTPVTVAKLAQDDFEYLCPDTLAGFDGYLSFSGGPILERLASEWGARNPQTLYCSVDPDLYYPEETDERWDLGYMGTYSSDRQPIVDRLLLQAAEDGRGRFVVAGPQYPVHGWPANVERIEHLPPDRHRAFYCAQRFTLNVTRAHMVRAGYSPSVRLFEAAACGVPIISDWWEGLGDFFKLGSEVLVAESTEDTLRYLWQLSEAERRGIGEAARRRVLGEHTSDHRAAEFEQYVHTLTRQRVRERP